MTGAELKAWQTRHGFTYDSAAAALGVARSTYALYLKSAEDLPEVIRLACLAIDAGLHKKSGVL